MLVVPRHRKAAYAAKEIEMVLKAYCVRCKIKRAIIKPEKVVMKNGKLATQGKCPVCGTAMFVAAYEAW